VRSLRASIIAVVGGGTEEFAAEPRKAWFRLGYAACNLNIASLLYRVPPASSSSRSARERGLTPPKWPANGNNRELMKREERTGACKISPKVYVERAFAQFGMLGFVIKAPSEPVIKQSTGVPYDLP